MTGALASDGIQDGRKRRPRAGSPREMWHGPTINAPRQSRPTPSHDLAPGLIERMDVSHAAREHFRHSPRDTRRIAADATIWKIIIRTFSARKRVVLRFQEIRRVGPDFGSHGPARGHGGRSIPLCQEHRPELSDAGLTGIMTTTLRALYDRGDRPSGPVATGPRASRPPGSMRAITPRRRASTPTRRGRELAQVMDAACIPLEELTSESAARRVQQHRKTSTLAGRRQGL